MSARYQFDPSARAEYHAAIRYYANEAGDAEVAARFVTAVESAIGVICALPETWRAVELPALRRYVLQRFPFVPYYQYRSVEDLVIIYAVMHTSRQPGYWRGRIPSS